MGRMQPVGLFNMACHTLLQNCPNYSKDHPSDNGLACSSNFKTHCVPRAKKFAQPCWRWNNQLRSLPDFLFLCHSCLYFSMFTNHSLSAINHELQKEAIIIIHLKTLGGVVLQNFLCSKLIHFAYTGHKGIDDLEEPTVPLHTNQSPSFPSSSLII